MSFIEKVGLQLYTVRDEAEKDFLGTLEKVAGMGYKGVEFAGFFNTPARELKEVLEKLSLIPVASHTPVELLKDDLDSVIEYNKEIGTRAIICPWTKIDSYEDVVEVAELMNTVAPKIIKAGMKVGYHNHGDEFKIFNGEYGLDLLMNLTEKAGVFPEIDVFWVEYAGVDAINYISKYKNRCEMVHLKDMKKRGETETVEIGNGILDIKGIIKKSLASGVKYFLVEQDNTDKPSLEAVKISIRNLKAIAAEMNIS